MRSLLPSRQDDVDLYEAYRPDRSVPSLRLNMVLSADGRAQDPRGRSGGLGGEGDREVFRVLRAHADAILVGAGTVRVEGYGPHRLREDLRERRVADGKPLPAPIVVVSRSLDVDLSAPLFTEARTPTVVLTCAAAPEERRQATARAGVLMVAGEREVDLGSGLAMLRDQLGLVHVLCEGGPTLNASLFSGGLVDELCLTVSPTLVGEPGASMIEGAVPTKDLELCAALEQDGELYLRYRVRTA